MTRVYGNRPLRLRLRARGVAGIARAAGRRPLGRGLWSLGLPAIAALVNDLRKPDGYLRPFVHKLISRKPQVRVIDAQVTQIEQKNEEIEKK